MSTYAPLVPPEPAVPGLCAHQRTTQTWCYTCWQSAAAKGWDAVEHILADTLRYGGHVLEELPCGTLIDWWVDGDVEPKATARHREPTAGWGGAHAVFTPGHAANEPAMVAAHLRHRAERFGFRLFLFTEAPNDRDGVPV